MVLETRSGAPRHLLTSAKMTLVGRLLWHLPFPQPAPSTIRLCSSSALTLEGAHLLVQRQIDHLQPLDVAAQLRDNVKLPAQLLLKLGVARSEAVPL